MKVESIAECSIEHSAILLTCIKRLSVLKTKFWSFLEWPLKTSFTVFNLIFGRKMQLIVLSWVSWGVILALWNALKPFSATGLHPWLHTGGGGGGYLQTPSRVRTVLDASGTHLADQPMLLLERDTRTQRQTFKPRDVISNNMTFWQV